MATRAFESSLPFLDKNENLAAWICLSAIPFHGSDKLFAAFTLQGNISSAEMSAREQKRIFQLAASA